MKIVTSDLVTGGFTVWSLEEDLKLTKREEFGQSGRESYIQQFAAFHRDGSDYLILGRKGLLLDIYQITSNNNFKLLKTKKLITTKNKEDFFIKIEVYKGQHANTFRASTGLGYCYFFDLDLLIDSKYSGFSMSFGLHGSISFFETLPRDCLSTIYESSNDDTVIVGGKDRELSIIDVDQHTQIWKSKSVRKVFQDKQMEGNNESVEKKEPLWIQNIVIDYCEVNNEISIIAATRFGKLLIYNPTISRFPTDERQIMENPIKHILKVSKSQILLADSFDNVLLYDFKKEELVNSFKIKTGALCSMKVHNIEENKLLLMVASNIDKKLRLYLVEDSQVTLLSSCNTTGVIPEILLLETDTLPSNLTLRRIKRMRI